MATLSSLATIYVKVPVRALEAGVPVDVTVGTVTMGFAAPGTEPAAWNTASWETDSTRSEDRYLARCLVGPDGGVLELDEGRWSVWVRVTGISPETPVLLAEGPALVVT